MDDFVGFLIERGAAVVGFADLGRVAEPARRGLPRAVALGMALTPRTIADIRQGPTDEYKEEYDRVNGLLGELAGAGAEFLTAQDWQAIPLAATGEWLPDGFSAPFQHKTAARLAGLGWIGKCALLITREYGAALRWTTILTDAPLPVVEAAQESQCGACDVCVQICPGHAPSGKPWQEGMGREDFWDPKACIQGLKRIAEERQVHSPICGMCVANCPYTVSYLKRVGAV